MPDSAISVVPIGDKICNPFLLDVMVFTPESGYKFKVTVECSCTPQADELWKLVFDLFQVAADKETQIVHVSFTTGTPVEQKAVQVMASQGVNPAQADVLVSKVYPATKALEGVQVPSQPQTQAIHDAMQNVVDVSV